MINDILQSEAYVLADHYNIPDYSKLKYSYLLEELAKKSIDNIETFIDSSFIKDQAGERCNWSFVVPYVPYEIYLNNGTSRIDYFEVIVEPKPRGLRPETESKCYKILQYFILLRSSNKIKVILQSLKEYVTNNKVEKEIVKVALL